MESTSRPRGGGWESFVQQEKCGKREGNEEYRRQREGYKKRRKREGSEAERRNGESSEGD